MHNLRHALLRGGIAASLMVSAGLTGCAAGEPDAAAAQDPRRAGSAPHDSGTSGRRDAGQSTGATPRAMPRAVASTGRTARGRAGPGDTASATHTANSARGASPSPVRDSTARRDTMRSAYRDSLLNALWPVKGPDPLPGAILPNRRIVAFYGNPLSTRMGVLGEYEPEEMLRRLDAEVAAWEAADPTTPVEPALHLIAVVAQEKPGRDGKYRLRVDSEVIERVAGWARQRDALVFLDLQVGLSTLQEELPRLVPFLSRPNFHLAIDPEFSMKRGGLPGQRIGTYDAEDVNYASAFLANLVDEYALPPKVLVVHRFTQRGLTNYQDIRLDARVQIVIDMDGFGSPTLKRGTFRNYIKAEPVQFAGWKQFFKSRNDNPRTTIAEILRLWPRPVYIQYQ